MVISPGASRTQLAVLYLVIISEVYDIGNVLYLGSYQSSFLGKLELKD